MQLRRKKERKEKKEKREERKRRKKMMRRKTVKKVMLALLSPSGLSVLESCQSVGGYRICSSGGERETARSDASQWE